MPNRATTDTASWTWSSVMAGVIASLVVQVMLTMLGLGIGLLSIEAPSDGRTISWAGFGWWAVSGIIAAFIGGWVAGAFSPTEDQRLKGAGALCAWAVATLLVVGAAGLGAGTTANVMGSLAGPSLAISNRIASLNDSSGRLGTGRGSPEVETAMQEARRQLATAMLASFLALLIGAGAAFAGGSMARTMPGRAARSSD